MTKTILVTGASEGIGLEISRLAAAQGMEVLMVARNAARLEAAAAQLSGPIAPQIAAIDLSDAAALGQFLKTLDARGYVPDILVNNAGQGASGAFIAADWDKLDAMIRVNVVGLAQLSHWAATRMARQRGDHAARA